MNQIDPEACSLLAVVFHILALVIIVNAYFGAKIRELNLVYFCILI